MTLAWHFTGKTLRDGRSIPESGEWLVHSGPIEICVSGLHASEDVWDALSYAPGAILHMVDCDDIHARHPDKLVCSRRKIIKSVDCTDLLRRFACDCALSVLPNEAPSKVREYLASPQEGTRAAARAAAWDAARDAMADDFRSRVYAAFGETQRSEG